MRRFKLVVFSEPDICALPGFTTEQRFKLHSVSMGRTLNKYMAIISSDERRRKVRFFATSRGANGNRLPK
jgi:hypothetical protein